MRREKGHNPCEGKAREPAFFAACLAAHVGGFAAPPAALQFVDGIVAARAFTGPSKAFPFNFWPA